MIILDIHYTHDLLIGPRPLHGFAPIHQQWVFDYFGIHLIVIESYRE